MFIITRTKFVRKSFGRYVLNGAPICGNLIRFYIDVYSVRAHSITKESISTDSVLQFYERFHFHIQYVRRFIYCCRIPLAYFWFSFIHSVPSLYLISFFLCRSIHPSQSSHISHKTMFVEPYMRAMIVGQWSHRTRMWVAKTVVNGIILGINLIN